MACVYKVSEMSIRRWQPPVFLHFLTSFPLRQANPPLEMAKAPILPAPSEETYSLQTATPNLQGLKVIEPDWVMCPSPK